MDASHHGGRRVSSLPVAWAIVLAGGAWLARPHRAHLAFRHRANDKVANVSRPTLVIDLVLLAGALLAVASPLWFAPIFIGTALGAPALLTRRAVRRREQSVARSLPDVVDLFDLAVGAGLNVSLAVEAVARRASGPLAVELAFALEEVHRGRRLADALGDIPARSGEAVRPLVDALVSSDRYGARLGDALPLLASEVRADRRRRAEEIARRVPVKLLFPLVFCVLPAFALLTLAPLLAGAAAALRP